MESIGKSMERLSAQLGHWIVQWRIGPNVIFLRCKIRAILSPTGRLRIVSSGSSCCVGGWLLNSFITRASSRLVLKGGKKFWVEAISCSSYPVSSLI